MSSTLRQKLNANPGIVTAVVSALVVLAVTVVIFQILGSRRTFRTELSKAYFSTDDGQTWFAATIDHVPPFEHEGKTAVRAYVFECGGREFVGYLERYTPAAKAVLDAHYAQSRASVEAAAQADSEGRPRSGGGMPANLGAIMGAQISGKEVKLPGETEWVPVTQRRRVAEMTQTHCPENPNGAANLVLPD